MILELPLDLSNVFFHYMLVHSHNSCFQHSPLAGSVTSVILESTLFNPFALIGGHSFPLLGMHSNFVVVGKWFSI